MSGPGEFRRAGYSFASPGHIYAGNPIAGRKAQAPVSVHRLKRQDK